MLLNFSIKFFREVSLGDLGVLLSSVHFSAICAHIVRFSLISVVTYF